MNDGVSTTRRFAVEIKSERKKAIECADQTLKALKIAVHDIIKNGMYTLRGVPKGAYTSDPIWPPLLDKVLNINLKGSIIVIAGNRKFDCVRVFQAASQAVLAAGTAVSPQSESASTPDRLTRGEAAVHAAVSALFPGGMVPKGLRVKERDEQIEKYLKNKNDLSRYGAGTIKRYFRKKNKRKSRSELSRVVRGCSVT